MHSRYVTLAGKVGRRRQRKPPPRNGETASQRTARCKPWDKIRQNPRKQATKTVAEA